MGRLLARVTKRELREVCSVLEDTDILPGESGLSARSLGATDFCKGFIEWKAKREDSFM